MHGQTMLKELYIKESIAKRGKNEKASWHKDV